MVFPMANEHGPHLQAEIIVILEHIQPASVREVVDQLDPPRAFTTVATVLGRMLDQGRVVRESSGGRFVYRVAPGHNQKLARHIAALLDRAAGDPEVLLQALVGGVEQIDPNLLERLERLIAERRRERS
jgi:predicted transcriptional regulator